MKYRLPFFLIGALAALGCENEPLGLETETQADAHRAPYWQDVAVTESDVFTFEDMALVGSSRLTRAKSRIRVTLKTTELTPRHTYTLWWVVFDAPENCSAPACGEDDVFDDALAGGPNLPEVTILGAADGRIARRSGRTIFAGMLHRGDVSKAIFGDGLDNPMTAEVHLVVRSHGEKIPGLIREQLTTFNGGCDPGQPNEGQCVDVQFSVHEAAN